MHGLHLTADLHGCRCAPHWLTDADALGRACLDAVAASGLQAVGQVFHTFPATAHGPGGVTAAVLLALLGSAAFAFLLFAAGLLRPELFQAALLM